VIRMDSLRLPVAVLIPMRSPMIETHAPFRKDAVLGFSQSNLSGLGLGRVLGMGFASCCRSDRERVYANITYSPGMRCGGIAPSMPGDPERVCISFRSLRHYLASHGDR